MTIFAFDFKGLSVPFISVNDDSVGVLIDVDFWRHPPGNNPEICSYK